MWRRQLRLMGIPSVSPLTWCWCWIEKSGAQNKNLKRQIRYICVFVPQVIFSACELGVFDLLLKSQEPLSAQHVARELETSEDGMERLLDALVGIEILEVENTKGTGEEEAGATISSVTLYLSRPLYLWRTTLTTGHEVTSCMTVLQIIKREQRLSRKWWKKHHHMTKMTS